MANDRFWELLAKKFSGEASLDELMELALLQKKNPSLSHIAENLHQFWQATSPVEKSPEDERSFKDLLQKIQQPFAQKDLPIEDSPAKSRSRGLFSLAKKKKNYVLTSLGVFLILISGAFLLLNPVNSQHAEKKISTETAKIVEVSTKPGSKTRLVLPDSSIVWLNAGSKLNYATHFGTAERTVTLTGEAYFDVKKSTIPFLIHAGKVRIKVLGTAFNVRNYPEEEKVETSLIRGKVEVTMQNRPETKYALTPNEKLVLNTAENLLPSKNRKDQEPFSILSPLHYLDNNTIVETSWIENKLVFDDETFEEVASKMERWYGIKIIFKNERLKKERLHGTIENLTIQQALEYLKYSTPFRYSSNKNNDIILNN